MTQYNNFSKTTTQDLNTLHKVIRITNLNNLTYDQAKISTEYGAFLPVLNKGDMVRCEFVGIGEEIDDTHYAIVWKAPANNETITVIPVTSTELENRQYQFSIGLVENFITVRGSTVIKPTYVYLNKMQEVSRKRITPWTYENTSGGSEIIKLNKEQIDRINDAIKVFYLDFNYLEKAILENGLQLPIKYPEYILDNAFRPIYHYILDNSDRKEFKANFMFQNGFTGEIKMFYPGDTSSVRGLCKYIRYDYKRGKFRERIIKALFSGDKNRVLEAKTIINQLYSEFLAKKGTC
ncbi:type II toxin-antitoxin system PemK/MazF family toxin [Clostridium sp. YIM B02515]|uniref:Type II toxin-antitoxin system PemK/MazF family toxin n=1 Tax=Clostridium rhizosphaerae TaxID=2803861 RepID=A0ABS1TED6_9CLOT|nr:type II toxin-antitoxin system PemK/MazF family toxin [Clostridium rhizosphaerae]MBL4937734.1 type II toxin-antitoxin system PemK/MazF family toxin [Clostridium rhizosphaerae]